MKDVNNRFKEIRKILNKSQKEISQELDVSQSVISDIERGILNLSYDITTKLIKLYNINLNWLFIGEGSMFKDGKQLDIQKEVMSDSRVKELELKLKKVLDEKEELKKSVSTLEKENAELAKDNRERLKELLNVERLLREQIGHT